MADPTKPTIDYSYSGFQLEQQINPFPGTQLDNDLAKLENGIGATIDALKDIRRADGKLSNDAITADAFGPGLLSELELTLGDDATQKAARRFADVIGIADIPYSAVGDFDPVAKTGTDNSAAISAALAAANGPVTVPRGNFMFTDPAVIVGLSKYGANGPGRLYYKAGSTVFPVGKRQKIGVGEPDTVNGYIYQGGPVIGGEDGGDGILLWSQGNPYLQLSPTKTGSAIEVQVYNNAPALRAVSVNGTKFIDTTNGYTFYAPIKAGRLFVFRGELLRIASVVSPTRISVSYPNGSTYPDFTGANAGILRYGYVYAEGKCDVAGTVVTRKSGEAFIASGSAFGQQFMTINGTEYTIATVASKDSLTLTASAGTLTNATYYQEILPAPYYRTLFRLQGMSGADEENFAIYLDLFNRTIFRNQQAGAGEIGKMVWASDLADDGSNTIEHMTMNPDGTFDIGFPLRAVGTLANLMAKVNVFRRGSTAPMAGGSVLNRIYSFLGNSADTAIRALVVAMKNDFDPPYLQAMQDGGAVGALKLNPDGGRVELAKGDWQNPAKIGAVYIWENAGILRYKNGAPTSATDGTPL